MNLNKEDGSIQKFITIEPVATSTTTPTYTAYQGVYHEEKEAADNIGYYYVSFVKDSYMHFLKFTVSDLKIQWHYSYYLATNTYKPRFLVMDPMANDQFYIVG